jgi:hypothetical protein
MKTAMRSIGLEEASTFITLSKPGKARIGSITKKIISDSVRIPGKDNNRETIIFERSG